MWTNTGDGKHRPIYKGSRFLGSVTGEEFVPSSNLRPDEDEEYLADLGIVREPAPVEPEPGEDDGKTGE